MNYIIKKDSIHKKNDTNKSCLVMLSSYNGEKYIRAQIDSILKQENVEVHILIRDDGSKDNTLKILYDLKKENIGKIELISGENLGIHGSFRELILSSSAEYDFYAFSDQDDVWDSDKLCVAINSLIDKGADFYSCAARMVNDKLEPIGMDTVNEKKYSFYMNSDNKILSPGVQGCTMVISSKLMSKLKSTDYPSTYGHDTWITLVGYYLYNCIYDANTHMAYRQHDESWTGNRDKKIKQAFIKGKYFFKGLERYKKLSDDLLKRYGKEINNHDREILNGVAYNRNVILKIKYLHTFRLAKYRWYETMILRLYYIFS